jgi:hypothetical protein
MKKAARQRAERPRERFSFHLSTRTAKTRPAGGWRARAADPRDVRPLSQDAPRQHQTGLESGRCPWHPGNYSAPGPGRGAGVRQPPGDTGPHGGGIRFTFGPVPSGPLRREPATGPGQVQSRLALRRRMSCAFRSVFCNAGALRLERVVLAVAQRCLGLGLAALTGGTFLGPPSACSPPFGCWPRTLTGKPGLSPEPGPLT